MLATVVVYAACTKDSSMIATYQTDNGGTSYVRVIHASPYFRNVWSAPDSFNIYINNSKINSPFLTYGSLFPSTTSNGYVSVPSGLQQVRFSVNGIVNVDSLTFATLSPVFVQGAYYSLIVTDSLKTSTNLGTQMLLRDTLNPVLQGYYNLRFVNTVYTDSLISTTGKFTVDVFSYARNAVIWQGIPAGGVTSFQTLATNISIADTLYVTRTPTSTASATYLPNRVVLAKLAVTPLNRNYTLLYRGDATLASGTKAKALAIYAHQ